MNRTLSIQAVFASSVMLVAGVGMALGWMTTQLDREAVIEHQNRTTTELLSRAAADMRRVLEIRAVQLIAPLAADAGFGRAVSAGDHAAVSARLNGLLGHPLVKDGGLKALEATAYTGTLADVATAVAKTDLNPHARRCPQVLNRRTGAPPGGTFSTLCVKGKNVYHVVVLPVSHGKVFGYVKLVSDAMPELLALETKLATPILLTLDRQTELYRSAHWRGATTGERAAVEVELAAPARGSPGLYLHAAGDLHLLIRELEDSHQRLLIASALALLFTMLAALLWLRRRVTAPMRSTLDFVAHVADARESARDFSPTGAAEVQALGKAVGRIVADYTELTASLAGKIAIDPVTGLPNRIRFIEQLQGAVARAQQDYHPFAVIVIDLDQFKEINNTLGHRAGDIVLRDAAARLRAKLREIDFLARIDGDEFGVLLPQVSEKDALIAARMLLQVIRKPFVVEEHTLDLNASLGIVFYPDHGVDANTLLKRADVAMYSAKLKGRGHALYEPALDSHSPTQLLLLGQLRNAVDQEEFVLYYQPRVDLHRNRVSGVEALVRWQHPAGHTFLPDSFIPLLEKNGLIKNLTQWMLSAAFAQSRRLHEAGRPVSVSANLSVRDLQDPYFVDMVAEQMAAQNARPEWLTFEITESAVMTDPQHAIRVLSRLSEMGFKIAVDDFGTGYSSLAYLKELPVGEVKIDKSFVINMAKDDNDAAIVRTSIELARNLGLVVVAEGVESEEILLKLRSLDCDAAQGMYISRPLSAEELDEWLAKSSWSSGAHQSLVALPGKQSNRWH